MRATLRSVALLALFATAAAVPAFAQGAGGAASAPPLSQYPACTTKPTQAETDAAHGAYIAGKGSFDEADYTKAIDYFKDAYRRDCTKPELLLIIARAYELKGDRREAVNALETYLQRKPDAPDAETQRRHIANLKKELADQAASASASASAIPPSASASASASAAPSASASAAPSATASATSEPPPAGGERGHTLTPWIVAGAGGVALLTGGALFLVGSGDVSSAESACGSGHTACPDKSSADKGNSGRSLETVGVIVGGVGLAGVVGGLVWHFLEPTGAAASPAQTGRPVIAPQVAPGYAGVGVGARF
jgi:hypothetical protein